MVNLTILEGDELNKLARLIHHKELETIQNVKFDSEPELAKYLRICKENLDSVKNLINDATGIKEKFENDIELAPIAHDIYSYVHNSVNFGVQSVKNYTVRAMYLTKIKKHSDHIISELGDTKLKDDVIKVRRLAKEASDYKKSMLEYTKMHQSPVSELFSKSLKERGVTFQNLVRRYKRMRGFTGPFKNLENEKKLQVYNDIIKASGRGNAKVNKLTKITGATGIVVLIFLAALMVWDIFSSEHVIQTATRDAVEAVAVIGGAVIGEVVGAALPSLIGIEASSTFVMMAGIVGSIAGVFLFGAFAGWLIDLIFEYGDDSVSWITSNDHRYYVAPLPDGELLARRIAHKNQIEK